MSAGENGAGRRLESDRVRRLIEAWADGLAQAFESMAGERPEVRWEAASGPDAAAEGDEILWWEQPFTGAGDAAVWVAAARPAWHAAGEAILKGAGLESAEAEEVRSAWVETLGQSLGALARAFGAMLGHEVACEGGGEKPAGAPNLEFVRAHVTFPAAGFDLRLGLNQEFLEQAASEPAPAAEPETAAAADSSARSKTLDLLMEIDLPISISFGRIQLPMRDVLKLTTGSIVELDRDASEPVDVLVNRSLIARGEVVVVEGNYAVRIQHIVSRQDRLRTIR
jgi:flagellar motor switch protein FliN/FliY